MVSLSSVPATLSSMHAAKDITFSSYFLRPGGLVEDELLAAARRGSHVTVRLNGYFHDGSKRLLDWNKQAVRDLKKFNADVRMVHLSDTDGPMLHLKAAVCDGVAFMDDRNWTESGHDVVLRDTLPADVSRIKAAASYTTTRCDSVALTKRDALQREHDLIADLNTKRADIESETMTWQSPVYSAIKRLSAKGVPCRVLLSSEHLSRTTKKTIVFLEKMHVAVRLVKSSDKIAIADGKRAWVGSANATAIFPDPYETDWGMSTGNPKFVRSLQSRFNANWRAAKPMSS